MQNLRLSLAIPLLWTSLLLGACQRSPAADDTASKPQPAAPATPAAPAPAANPEVDARNLFDSKCVVCHGNHGAGDGPGAAALNPKPRAFGDAAWQASVTDEQIKTIVLEGGAGVGKSVAMPANPDLKDKAAELTALVKIVRNFKQ